MMEYLFSDIADIFERHCPDALKGVSVALVAMDSPDCLQDLTGPHRAVFTDPNQTLLQRFHKVYDFYPDRNDGALTLQNIESHYPHVRVDYVVTANVLNSPFERRHAQEIFLASARLLKTGGRAIHLVGYSSDNYELHVSNPSIIAQAGQRVIAALPMTFAKVGFLGDYDRSGCKDFIIFEQVHGVAPNLPAKIQSLAALSGEPAFETLR